MNPVQRLEQRCATNPTDARARFELAVLLLGMRDRSETGDSTMLERAEQLLAGTIRIDPTNARAHAALGYVLRERGGRDAEALRAFRTARRLGDTDVAVDVYVPVLLSALGQETAAVRDLAAVARRHPVHLGQNVDLRALRAQLRKEGYPTDVQSVALNAYFDPRNWLWSSLQDDAERIGNRVARGAPRRQERATCQAMQDELRRAFRRTRVPAALRPLASAAAAYGIGDDLCRVMLMRRIPRAERSRLRAAVRQLGAKVDEWLRSFPEDEMSVEAAAFMYLLTGLDETPET